MQATIYSIIDVIYPIGAVFISTNAALDPSVLFTGTTWQKIEEKFLLGSSSAYSVGDTGGEATHTLTITEIPSHNHTFTGSAVTSGTISADHTHGFSTGLVSADHAHTGPSHEHSYKNFSKDKTDPTGDYAGVAVSGSGATYGTNAAGTGWTGGISANHTHSGTTGGVSANHTHSVTAAGSIGNTGSGGAHNNMPPYLVVDIWKRIA